MSARRRIYKEFAHTCRFFFMDFNGCSLKKEEEKDWLESLDSIFSSSGLVLSIVATSGKAGKSTLILLSFYFFIE